MGNIVHLDKTLINQIAAGEVVERPYSVVKELVENAIDAHGNQIKIQIYNGGKQEIIIHDNGDGINKDDLAICLEKHTTSKIKSLGDLYEVLTFGFRGEALAAISSVSNMSIISKQKDNPIAYQLEYSDEKGQIIHPTSYNNGTCVSVKNIFYNTPARLNYLKQEKTEYNKILHYLENIVLSYPQIGFEFYSDDKKIFKYNQNESLKTRIYDIYGEEFTNSLIEIEFEMTGIKVSGYISDPKIHFLNKNKQHIFVNTRPIQSGVISKAISDAYNRFIPHGSFPAYIINIHINPTLVDVNVHPRKTEIRFENEQNIFRVCYHAILNKLEHSTILENPTEINPYDENILLPNSFTKAPTKHTQETYYTGSGANLKEFSPYKKTQNSPHQFNIENAIHFSQTILQPLKTNFEHTIEQQDLHYTKLGKIIGQTFDSYIIVEKENKMLIFDQHALAERIIYERLIHQEQKISIQKLLIPESIKLSSGEGEIFSDKKEIFSNMGFEIEEVGNNIITIYSIPDFIKKEQLNTIILGIIGDIEHGNIKKIKTLDEVKNKIYAYTACRSAIKFGNKLNLFEMNKLLNNATETYSSTCPHGRPVIFEIDLLQLKEKYDR